jgi:hypothetical protein
MRDKNGDAIDYVPMASGNIAVYLANQRVGTIARRPDDRWRYVPAGKSFDEGGQLFDTIAKVKASLEES